MRSNIPSQIIFSKRIIEEGFHSLYGNNSYTDKNFKILEIGSGIGARFTYFKNNLPNTKYYSFDINLEQLKKGKTINDNSDSICTDIERLPFKDSSFDLILSHSVFQYIDWEKILIKFSQILKKEGEFFFIENLSWHPFAVIYRFLYKVLGLRYSKYSTPKAHIKFSELKYFKKHFLTSTSYYHLTTPVVLIIPLLFKRKGEPIYLKSDKIFNLFWQLDKFLITKFAIFNRLCWFVAIRGKKIGRQ